MKHFIIDEFTRSETARQFGINNQPTLEHLNNIVEFVETLLDPLREAWAIRCAHEQYGTPMLRVSSGYRSQALNAAVKGSATSSHCIGYAADIIPLNYHLKEFKAFCREYLSSRKFDQLISEAENDLNIPQWIHIGYKNRDGKQRKQMLSMKGGEYLQMTK